ncbi:Hsp20/alpha crystallin family protein [Actinosynnema sp. NPDC004786]
MTLPAVRPSRSPDRWDPFREFEDLYRQLGRWMDTVSGGPDGAWSPSADVSETEDAYLVEVELPGVRREDVAVELAGGELAISGEFKEKERQGLFRHRTRRTGRFAYRVTLPREVDADAVAAELADGVLTVRAPKGEAARPRRIAITGR